MAEPMGHLPVLEDLGDVAGKRVLVRTDFNVPIHDGVITDDFRIRSALPTITWLLRTGATVVCASHLGRPKGKPDPKYTMEPVRERLAELAPGVELLENLRYDPGEEGNDPAFVARLVEGMSTST
jgi:phosphoglycerate kinase